MNTKIKENEEKEIIEKYNTKSWFKSCLLGFLIGIAVIVPGISGSTIAIIFRLYEKIIYAISNVFKKFVRVLIFFIPIIIGLIIGWVLGFFAIQEIIALVPFTMVAFFAGLMVGSAPSITDEVKGEKITPLRIVLLILGILIPVSISLISINLNLNTNLFKEFPWYSYLIMIPLGFVIAATQIIPGLSATAILMAFGLFKPLLNSVSLSNLTANPQWFGIYACLGVGLLVGIFAISKAINYMLRKYRISTFYLIIGFVVGSIIIMFINSEILSTYNSWITSTPIVDEIHGIKIQNVNMVIDLSIGIPIFFVGSTLAYLLVRYQREHNQIESK